MPQLATLPPPFYSFCAWCISCGNVPCAKTAKIFPVAEGDPSQGPSCSVEQEHCPHCVNSPERDGHLLDDALYNHCRVKMNHIRRTPRQCERHKYICINLSIRCA